MREGEGAGAVSGRPQPPPRRLPQALRVSILRVGCSPHGPSPQSISLIPISRGSLTVSGPLRLPLAFEGNDRVT